MLKKTVDDASKIETRANPQIDLSLLDQKTIEINKVLIRWCNLQ